MAAHANITRRRALKTIPAVGMAAIVPAAATAVELECPYEKLRRLSRELSEALDQVDHCSLAMIYPASEHEFPVVHVLDKEFSRMSRAMFAYRDAHNEKVRIYTETFMPDESVPLPPRPEHQRYWDAFHRCNLAHYELVDLFDTRVTIDA